MIKIKEVIIYLF